LVVDLADFVVGRPVRLATQHHQHEVLRLPAKPDELRLEPLPLRLVAEVDAPVRDPRGALHPLGFGGELLGGRVAGLLGPQEVEVVDAVQTRVEDNRAVRRRFEPLRRQLVQPVHQREGALELTHRRVGADGRACSARRCHA
jgi:hypothetical protein